MVFSQTHFNRIGSEGTDPNSLFYSELTNKFEIMIINARKEIIEKDRLR